MRRSGFTLFSILAVTGLFAAAQDAPPANQDAPEKTDAPVVFRSDVALVRVDTQVVDRDNRPITGLRVEDFVLRENGKVVDIKNFARENMPMDVLFLFDVSRSMRPHIQRVADAAHEALRALGEDDRVAVMVFDRSSRIRMPFRTGRSQISRGIDSVIDQESFNGGTDITRGLLDAANYVGREARKEARRAIVIVTDDMTEFNRDEDRVEQAMARNGGIVLSALIAPDAMGQGGYGGGGGRRGGGGGGYPGGNGGSWPNNDPLGTIIFGRRGGYGGGGNGRGPVSIGGRTKSAGTSEIARSTGGDSLPVDDASALETTLNRLRQRYALHFNHGDSNNSRDNVSVDLASAARRRYPDAEVRYRRVSMNGDTVMAGTSRGGRYDPQDDTEVARTTSSRTASSGSSSDDDPPPTFKRRRGVSEPSTGGPMTGDSSNGGWRRAGDDDAPSQNTPAVAEPKSDSGSQSSGGRWRKLKPGEQP